MVICKQLIKSHLLQNVLRNFKRLKRSRKKDLQFKIHWRVTYYT